MEKFHSRSHSIRCGVTKCSEKGISEVPDNMNIGTLYVCRETKWPPIQFQSHSRSQSTLVL